MSYAFRTTQYHLICSDPVPTALAPRLLQIQSPPRTRHTTAHQQHHLRRAGTSYLPVVLQRLAAYIPAPDASSAPCTYHIKPDAVLSTSSHSETGPAVYQLDSQHTCPHISIRQAAIQPSYKPRAGSHLLPQCSQVPLHLPGSRLTPRAPIPAKASPQASSIELPSSIELLDDRCYTAIYM